jgi:hypothetical protein
VAAARDYPRTAVFRSFTETEEASGSAESITSSAE